MDSIREALADNRIEVSGGIGSIDDSAEILGTERRPISVSPCQISDETQFAPRRLHARFYEWRLNRDALRFVAEDDDRAFRLHATDVLISKEAAGGPDDYLCLIAERGRGYSESGVPAELMARLAAAGDGNSSLSRGGTSLDVIDSDFFLWSLYRSVRNSGVSPAVTILKVDRMEGSDVFERGANFRSGVSEDRPEVLAMVMNSHTRFGPATLVLMDDELDLTISVEIFGDGGFAPKVSASDYHPDDLTDRPERNDLAKRLVDDFAYKIFPEIVHSYNMDFAWRSSDRANFVSVSAGSLADVIRQMSARS